MGVLYLVPMCGAYGFSAQDAEQVYDRFAVANTLPDFTPRYNLRPGQLNPVITSHSPNTISRMFWGLIPHFAQDVHYKYKTINAKAETVAQLPSFREPLKTKRCLIPATGFYEPDKIHTKRPPFPWHYFQLKNGELFAFAGLYDLWKEKELKQGKWVEKEGGKQVVSYTIITTTPNTLVGKIHDRMPVILHKEDEATWLNPDIVEPERLLPLEVGLGSL
jgi:putative SOS response-associated peptidase YedK